MSQLKDTKIVLRKSLNVTYDEEGVTLYLCNKIEKSFNWDDLLSVDFVTSKKSHFDINSFWKLTFRKGVLEYPMDCPGEDEILDEMMRKLKGFDHREMVSAVACLEESTFNLWQTSS